MGRRFEPVAGRSLTRGVILRRLISAAGKRHKTRQTQDCWALGYVGVRAASSPVMW
jgi:hypothetical protein